jgi:hypothetical protein
MITRYLPLVALLAIPLAAHGDDLTELLNRVPADMNTVAVINVRAINRTPRAVKEQWRENSETKFLAGAITVPPSVTVVVLGADLHPGPGGDRSVALFPVARSLNSTAIAGRENGVVQTVGDLTLVLSPRRGYFGFPAGGILAVSGTMTRQEFARWVRGARNPDKPAVSAYLQEAVAAHKDAHVLVATDLKDLFDPTSVRAALQASGGVSGEAEVNSLTNVLSGARGIVFTAQIGDRTAATVRMEFSVPMDAFVPAFQRLWPKALERLGFEVPELKAAESKADGRAVVMTTDLSDVGLRRILSLLTSPGDAVEGQEPIRTPKESAQLAASLRFYRAVNGALDDLKAQRGAKGSDFVRSAMFFERYAARIESLPLTEVDPVLVQYGASMAAKLRAMAGSLRGVRARLDVYESFKSTTWAAGGPGLFVTPRGRVGLGIGGGDVAMSTNVQEMDTRMAELVARLEPERAKIWGVLESDRSAIRREMLEKFRIDFDQFRK